MLRNLEDRNNFQDLNLAKYQTALEAQRANRELNLKAYYRSTLNP